MTRTAVFAALALVALVAAVVADKGIKGEAFMTKQLMPSSAKAQTSNDHHDDVEETTVRFKVSGICPGDENNPSSESILTVLTCDNDEYDNGYQRTPIGFAVQPTVVGYCWTNSDDYEFSGAIHHIPVPGNPNVGISGMYTMACNLNEAARECGVDVGKGGLQISSNGIVYEATAWATYNPLVEFPPLSSGCPLGAASRVALRHRGKRSAARGLKSEDAKVAYYHEREALPSVLYSGALYIFSGALTVSSVDADCPYDGQGFLEYLGPEDTNEGNEAWNTTTAAQLPSYAVGPLKHPFTVTMRFRSNKRNSY